MLATVGMTMAQDVYSAGYYTSNGQTKAAVYKNDAKLYESVIGLGDNVSTAVVLSHVNGDVYWTRNSQFYGDVMKNDAVFLNQQNQGTYIHDLCWVKGMSLTNGNPEYCLRSAGYRTGSDGKKYAAVWKGSSDTPQYSPNYENGYQSEAYGVIMVKDGSGNSWSTYSCGYYAANEAGDSYHACVWKGSNVHYTLPGSNSSIAYGIDSYNGYIYTVGVEKEGSNYVTKVWQDNSVLYTLTSNSSNSRGWKINVQEGDIWVSGWEGSTLKTWKNGTEVYSQSVSGTCNNRAVDVNSSGYYSAITLTGQGRIVKNGTTLYAISNCEYLYDICLAPEECDDDAARALPFYDGFEVGDTEWPCWTTVDVDNSNGGTRGYASYWHRYGGGASGDYCAKHGFNDDNEQEGWLISPKLFLQPGRDETKLTFKTREGAPSYYTYEGVWISTTNTNTSSFTEVWSQSSPSDSWNEVVIDLSAYQGQSIYIGFKYTGIDGHYWGIDDVEVTENWSTCTQYVDLPFNQTFDNEISWCWYNIDMDMSGGQSNWRYNESEHCAYHPWGQQNILQEGWLISRNILLPEGENITFTFDEKNYQSGANMKNSVLISVDHGTDIPDIADFSTVLWSDNSTFPTAWTQHTIDLSAYAGHNINIAFKYEGTYAHNWYIDNILIDAITPTYNINVVANNPSWGTVDGGGTFEQGETRTITATPNSGYEFIKWTKDGIEVSTSASYTFTVTENATYTAVFGEPAVTYYTISTNVNPAGAGTVTGGDTYAAGTNAVLTAIANEGWYFDHWNDNNTDNPRTITVNGNATYTAYFSQNSYTITVTADPAEAGVVTGSGTYNYGTTVELTATANEGFSFLTWNDGVTSAVRTVTVIEDASYTALFITNETTTYTVTALPNDFTLGEVTGGGTYPEGTSVTLTATPIGNAIFVKWSDESVKNPRTIVVNSDITITGIFEAPTLYTITVESLNPEMGSVSGGGNFPMGAEVVIQANPFGGFYFDGWDDNNLDNPRTITVSGNATYKAKFSAQQAQNYQLTVACDPTKGAVTGAGTYAAGTNVTVEAIPYDGYVFDHWNDGNTDNPRTVTINDNLTLVAFFAGTGVNELGEQALTIYPNPAKECIRIEGLEANSEVMFFNTLGMQVKTVNANAEQEINVSDLAAGIYMVRCGSQVIRFVKE